MPGCVPVSSGERQVRRRLACHHRSAWRMVEEADTRLVVEYRSETNWTGERGGRRADWWRRDAPARSRQALVLFLAPHCRTHTGEDLHRIYEPGDFIFLLTLFDMGMNVWFCCSFYYLASNL